jgi:hypothetical protein
MITILDIKKREQSLAYDLVEENVKLNPEFMQIPADTIPGTDMRLTVRTDLPSVLFSNLNEGVLESDDKTITRLFQTAFLDQLCTVDVRLLQAGGPAAAKVLTERQAGYVEAAIRTSCKQFWYGTQNDAKGFVGMIAQMINDAEHVIDAGGTTAGEKSSIFMVARGRGKVEWLLGNARTLTFGDWLRQTVARTVNGATANLDAMVSWMHFNPGVRLGNRNALVRIKNLTTQAGATATYDQLTQAYQQMTDDLGMVPDALFMTARSQRQLRDAVKTDLNPNPPLPTEWNGLPIYISSNIATGETI